ncbi:hypothetical protein EMIT019CA3_130049 [Bacillus pseudomycoides]
MLVVAIATHIVHSLFLKFILLEYESRRVDITGDKADFYINTN